MPNRPTVRIAALSALLSMGIGIDLGRATIAEIDPLYFSMLPSERVQRPTGRDSGFECIGCRTYPEEYRPRADPQVEALYRADLQGKAAEPRAPDGLAGRSGQDPDHSGSRESSPVRASPNLAEALQALAEAEITGE